MTIQDQVNPQQDLIWAPVLEGLGYADPELAPEALDLEEATDLIAGGYWFATRVRNPHRYSPRVYRQYVTEFTIRYSRPTGATTEWAKLFDPEEGYDVPDYMAYGWAPDDHTVGHHFVISVPMLREVHRRRILDRIRKGPYPNRDDKRSEFYAIPVDGLRRSLTLPEFRSLFVHVSKGHPAFRWKRRTRQ